MKFYLITAALVARVAATPVPAPGPFDNGSTFVLCTDPNLSGTCVFINYRFGQCIDVPVSINDQVSSVATKGSGHSCTLYRDYGCGGTTELIDHHIDFIRTLNDQVSSFRCQS
ncbi:hypothetical protein BJ165DRAFT_1606018 [Panaeolus papilionaceus]|nr:hypothetical protein BJ165DRAFT_1606018 [Panaeolus papilionaceus]